MLLFANLTAYTPSQSLHGKRVLSLDLAALLAGSGIRGQFEEKFKALLKDIEEEAGGVICFIDELRACDTLIPPSLTINVFGILP